jgi:hypothetical protein
MQKCKKLCRENAIKEIDTLPDGWRIYGDEIAIEIRGWK